MGDPSKGAGPRKLSVLGSTGSIGRATLDVAQAMGLRVVGITAFDNIELAAAQAAEHRPALVAVRDKEGADLLGEMLAKIEGGRSISILWGDGGLAAASTLDQADTVVMALPSAAGLVPSLEALRAGKRLCLASKEVSAAGGVLLRKEALAHDSECIPLDSELSALHLLLGLVPPDKITKAWLCASGGPFLDRDPKSLEQVTFAQASSHPVWSMGRKVSVDSATMMNKGLEIISASHLLDLPAQKLGALIHPECRVHALVQRADKSLMALMACPDMRWAVSYVLSFPDQHDEAPVSLDPESLDRLSFRPVDRRRFPAFALAERALMQGGLLPAVLSASDETAVKAFSEGRLSFHGIPSLLASVLVKAEEQGFGRGSSEDLEAILAADEWARQQAKSML